MIQLCRDASLPEPEFTSRAGSFVTTIWRNWLTNKVLVTLGLNDRQTQAVAFVKSHRRITNQDYQQTTGAERKTAARDLADLVRKKVLRRHGQKKGIYYTLRGK